jgi:5-oxoprolinase (ATP-hydrolysing)
MWAGDGGPATRRDTPLFDRSDLLPGDAIPGPAVIIEPISTIVIEPGWRSSFTARGHLVLERVEAAERGVAVGTAVDPVMLEIFNNLFMSIAEQMGSTL